MSNDVDAKTDQKAGMDTEDVEAEEGVEIGAGAAPQDGVREAGDLFDGSGEAQALRAVRAPYTPSAREVEAHELTHCPPRQWCDHCVKGQSKDVPHATIKGDLSESSIVRVMMDYCFLTEDAVGQSTDHEETEKAKTSLTVLVLVESLCRSIWAYAVESKGASEAWVVEQILEDMQTVGLSNERIILKTDQEPSITELQRSIVEARAGHGTAIENSRVGDSNSNGRVERAIQDFKGLVRTLRSALEAKTGGSISLDDAVVPWLVRHAAHLITASRVREDGRTAFQNMKGRRSSAKLVPFGETVLFKIPKTAKRVGAFEDRWETGIWVGFVMRSGEHLVATDTGVFKVSTVMRRAADRRWSADLVKSMRGTPECPVPGSASRRIPAFAKKHQSDAADRAVYLPAPEVSEPDVRPAQIHKSDVSAHGETEKCPGCRALKSGGKYRAKHSVECRKRFEAILSQSEKGRKRFEAAAERRFDAITKMSEDMQTKIDDDVPDADGSKATADSSGAAASGSGLTDDQRAASLKRKPDDQPDDSSRVERDQVVPHQAVPEPAVLAVPGPPAASRGTKRGG